MKPLKLNPDAVTVQDTFCISATRADRLQWLAAQASCRYDRFGASFASLYRPETPVNELLYLVFALTRSIQHRLLLESQLSGGKAPGFPNADPPVSGQGSSEKKFFEKN